MDRRNKPRDRCGCPGGFTLIELLVVMAIIGTLVSMLLPAVQRARESARRTQCLFHVRQISLAVLDYHTAHRTFPCGWMESSDEPGLPISRLPDTGLGWGALILPELGQPTVYNQIRFAAPLLGEPDRDADLPEMQNHETLVARLPLRSYRCPSSTSPRTSDNLHPTGQLLIADQATSNYIACFGSEELAGDATAAHAGNGIFFRNSGIGLQNLTDGSPYSFLIGEREWAASTESGPVHFGEAYWAGTPDSWLSDVLGTTGVSMNTGHTAQFSSRHPGGAIFGFADGHVEFISENIESFPGESTGPYMGVYQKLGNIRDGLPIGDY